MTDDDRRPHTTVRLVDPTHARLKDHCREGETLSGAVDRALDALEMESTYIDIIDDLAGADPEEPKPCGVVHPLPCGLDVDCPDSEGEDDG